MHKVQNLDYKKTEEIYEDLLNMNNSSEHDCKSIHIRNGSIR
jgi:hypothetical protein